VKISDTLSQYGGNFARATKYNILLSPPTSFVQYNKIFDVLGKSIQVPSITNTPIEFKIHGQNVKLPGRTQQQQEITITFYVDEALKIRNLFQDWIYALDPRNPVNKNVNSYAMGSKKDYYGNLTIIAKNFEENTDLSLYMFENIFPINVGEISYGSADKDTIPELTVTFAYYRFLTSGDYAENLSNFDDFLNSFGIIPDPRELGMYIINSSFKSFGGGGLDFFRNALNGLLRGITNFGNLANLF